MSLKYHQRPVTYTYQLWHYYLLIFKERSAPKVHVILIDSEIVVYKIRPAEVLHKFLVMCNDYELKVPLLLTSSNDSVQKKNTKK